MFKKIYWYKQETKVSGNLNKNPWLGLATYNTDDVDRFRGRDKAAQDVFSLIDNDLVVTLYGKSGIGKSSLINAGIIPMLSNVGYKVISVNIREMKASCSDGEGTYKRTIEYLKTLLHVELETIDETSLWKILHNKECFEEISEFPVIIFDQFEEVFLNTSPKDSDMFVKAISKLTDTGFSIDDDSFILNNRFRILLSLREDDLFRLEDSIDRNGFSRMKYNRYRLHSFTISEAESIIALGKEYFENYESSKQKITEISNLPDGGVDAATLSLLCYRLFEKSRNNENGIIKEELVSREKDPLYNQYMEEISSLTHKEQMFIENNLITSSGRRDLVDIEDFKNNIRNTERLLENSASHFSLFRVIDKGKNIELIHDSLAKAIYKNKSVRSNKLELKIKLIKFLLICISDLPLLYAGTKYMLHNSTTTEAKFYGISNWAWILLLVPVLNCVLLPLEKKVQRVVPLVCICFLMAINNGLLKFCFGIKMSNVYNWFDHNATTQILLFIAFFICSFFLFEEKKRITKYISILYLNLVILACMIPGFGHNVLIIHNVVGYDLGISIPWSYVVYEEDNKYGYSDWNGNQVFPCVFDSIVADSTLRNTLSKQVRTLDLKNEGLRNYYDSNKVGLPCYYKNGTLSFHILPMVENQIKELSNGTSENKLKASIIMKSRNRVIQSFTNNNSLYDAKLAKEIEILYTIQLDSAYNLFNSLKDSKSIITDETINKIRINLCKCICMLHMLESFGKQGDIKDDDIAHSILALQFFTLYEIMDTNVKGYNAAFNTTFNFNMISNGVSYVSRDFASFELKGYLEGNKRDIYSAFNNLIIFDLAIHQTDLQGFLDVYSKNAQSIYNDLLNVYDQTKKSSSDLNKKNALVLQNAISILLDSSSAHSKKEKLNQLKSDLNNNHTQVLENIIKQSESLIDKPLFLHNTDVFNYKKVIFPLIKCIEGNDIPDQNTALTDIACRLIVMGMFRGFEMHDCIEELQNAYKKSTERTIKKTFETVLTIDSMEVKYRQATNDFKRRLKDVELKKQKKKLPY